MNAKCLGLVGIFLLASCTTDPVRENRSEDNYKYPLSIGNQWVYSRVWSVYSLATGAIEVLDRAVDTCEIVRTERINDWDTFVLEQRYTDTQLTDRRSEDWYANSESGLYNCAYRNAGGGLAQPVPRRFRYEVGGIEFQSREEAIQAILGESSKFRTDVDSLIVWQPARLYLPYPPVIGTRWEFVEDNFPLKVERSIIGKWRIYLESGNFDCYVVRSEYFDHETGETANASMTDYIAVQGLVLREMEFLEVTTNPELPHDPGTRSLFRDIYTLTSYHLASGGS